MSKTTAVMNYASDEASSGSNDELGSAQNESSEHTLKVPESEHAIDYRDHPKTKLCYFYPRVPCKNGDNCKFIHSDLPRPPKIKKDKEQKRRDKEEKERRRVLEAQSNASASADASLPVEEASGDSGDECVATRSSVSMALALVEPSPSMLSQQDKQLKLSKNNARRDARRRENASKRTLALMNANANASVASQLEYFYAMNLMRVQHEYEAALQQQQQAVQYAALVPLANGAMGAVYFQCGQSVCSFYRNSEANEAPCYCSYCVMYIHACRHQHYPPPPQMSDGSDTLLWI